MLKNKQNKLRKFKCLGCGQIIYLNRPAIRTKYCSLDCYRKNHRGQIPWNRGKTGIYSIDLIEKWSEKRKKKLPSIETKLKMSDAHKGSKSHYWKGGITPINKILRERTAYTTWRTEVYKRDGYTCRDCGVKSGNGHTIYLHAHHIKPFAL